MKSKKKASPSKPALDISKEEIKAIKKRMSEIKKYANDKSTTQNTISYQQMFKDGTCALGGGKYSRTVQFFDADYSLAEFEQQDNIVTKYCDLLNSFDSSVSFQLTFENQNRSMDKLIEEITIPPQSDDFNDLREEYSNMLKDKLELGSNGLDTKKFITFTVEAKNIREARNKLSNIQGEVIRYFKIFGVKAKGLIGKERLETLYYSLNPFTDKPFLYDFSLAAHMGWNDKDFIAPPSIKFNKSDFEIGSAYGSVCNFSILAGELPDVILQNFMELPHLVCLNIHVKPFDQSAALKFIKLKLTDVEQMKIDEQKKASKAGYDPDILPPNIKLYIENLEDLLEKLNSKNERLFHISINIRSYSKTKKKQKLLNDLVKSICQQNNCMIMPCEYTQEDDLNTSLPLGNNFSQVSREMHTSGIAIFVPFTTKSLFQTGSGAAYYGVNPLSGNMIRANRKLLKNPNGLILGTPGSGKSFLVKREITDDYLTTDDDIIICDPEGEYYPLVNKFCGQIIKISSSSDQYINPMDINIGGDYDENPISVKSEFIISLCELIVGGKYGLTAEEHSVIDKCVTEIYRNFFANNPSYDKMPTLSDLHRALSNCGEIALRVANSLEMYVNGSQKLFNHRTNVDISNRTVCFDIKELGSQLKKIGMLIVQETVWNRVSLNRKNKKSTRYYMDEFHLLLKEEQTAKYSVEIWKRFRKWGGIPTGITQNVKDLLLSKEVENIFDNSDFVVMLNQAAGDREILAQKLHISPEKLEYITNSGQGSGLLRFGEYLLPFEDKFPTDTKLYQLMTTKLEEQ